MPAHLHTLRSPTTRCWTVAAALVGFLVPLLLMLEGGARSLRKCHLIQSR